MSVVEFRAPNIRICAAAILAGVLAATPVAGFATRSSAAALGPAQGPVVSVRKLENTENVYIFRYGFAQSMFVITPEGVIVTDPIGYGEPAAGPTYLAEIRKLTSAPIRYVIYSHHHFDHAAGGAPFKAADATFVAHENARRRLEMLADPDTVLPDEVVTDRRTIRLGGTELELTYLGPNHSDSSLVMRLPKEGVIFAVDIVPVGGMPGRGMLDSYPLEWEASLERLLGMEWDRLIPGHPGSGRMGTKEDVQATLDLLRSVSAEVKAQARAGQCWEGVEDNLKLERYASLPGYQEAAPIMLRRYCGLWGRGF